MRSSSLDGDGGAEREAHKVRPPLAPQPIHARWWLKRAPTPLMNYSRDHYLSNIVGMETEHNTTSQPQRRTGDHVRGAS